MLGESLFVNAYVIIKEGCPVAISVQSSDEAEIVFGWPPSRSFDFVTHREALRALVQLGSEALEKMDAFAADEHTDAIAS
ncbi:hypothetical protein [Actinophytocola sp. KF-1]